MPIGSCYCGLLKVEYTGEPIVTALCHCDNCRHYTGSMYSNNFLVENDNFKVTGTVKEITKTADSGNSITNCFCPNCGTTIYRYGDAFGGINGRKVLQAGVLDDPTVITNTGLVNEIFVPRRIGWIAPLEGVGQYEGMPPP